MIDREKSETSEKTETARDELRRAYLLVSFGRFDEAIEACRRADRLLEGGHPLPKTLAGNFSIARGDVATGLKLLREAIERFPDEPLPRIHFAEACFVDGRMRRGERALERARALDESESTFAELIDEVERAWAGVDSGDVPPPLRVSNGNRAC